MFQTDFPYFVYGFIYAVATCSYRYIKFGVRFVFKRN